RCVVELFDDLWGRTSRKKKGVPCHDVEVSKSLLVNGCQIRHQRRATTRQHRNCLYLIAHAQSGRKAHVEAHIIDLSPKQIIHGWAATSIRNMRDVHTDDCIEQRATKVRRGPGSR